MAKKKATLKKAAAKKVEVGMARKKAGKSKVLTKAIAEKFLADETGVCPPYCVDLAEFTVIEDEAAEILANFEGSDLPLDGLTSISVKAAESLSKFQGCETAMGGRLWRLHLNGVKSMSDEVGAALRKHNTNDVDLWFFGELYLDGLTSLSDGALAKLADFGVRRLHLNGLLKLSDDNAETLAQFKLEMNRECLALNGLTTLSDAAAGSLGRLNFAQLELNGLTSLSDPAAKLLARFNKRDRSFLSEDGSSLNLKGLTSLSDAALKALSRNKHVVLNKELASRLAHRETTQPAKAKKGEA